jgi:phosphatidylserine decarboxylase precursor
LLLVLLAGAGCCKQESATPQAPPATQVAAPTQEAAAQQRQPGTLELIAMMDADPALKAMLVKSLALAAAENPDRQTNPAQTLEEFYDFIDWSFVCMPWNILKDLPQPRLYEQIDQSLDYFYFALDRALPELEGKGLYRNSLQYHEPVRGWLIKYAKTWGEFLSTPASWNEEYLKKAQADERFGLTRGWYEDPANWKTFNDFFARYLKSPDQRPIAASEDDCVVVAPADSVPQGVWQIDQRSNLVAREGVAIKSSVVYSIHELLGKDSAFKDAFAGGILTHTFLDVQDYHRYHFPVAGTVQEVAILAQDDAAGGIMLWNAEKKKYQLDATVEGWQFIETRGVVVLQTAKYGLVAAIPVGMSQVSSVNFEANVKPGAVVKKGDMLGAFLFGGSDFIMLFQKDAGFQITAPAAEQGGYQHILMGEQYGRLGGPAPAPAGAGPAQP